MNSAPPLSWITRNGYGFGAIVNGAKGAAFSTYLMFFYNQVIGVPAAVVRGGLVYLHSLAGSLSGLPIAVMPLREAAGGCIADRVFACQGWNAA